MLICQNVKGEHGQIKVMKTWSRRWPSRAVFKVWGGKIFVFIRYLKQILLDTTKFVEHNIIFLGVCRRLLRSWGGFTWID